MSECSWWSVMAMVLMVILKWCWGLGSALMAASLTPIIYKGVTVVLAYVIRCSQ